MISSRAPLAYAGHEDKSCLFFFLYITTWAELCVAVGVAGPRRNLIKSMEDAAQDGSPVRATATCLSTPPNRRPPFLARMTKKTAKILPTPRAARLRSRALTPTAPPRRSRRIAGAAPETPNTNIPSRQKRKVMRALGIIGQAEGIDQRSLEEYSKLFTSSCALVSTHVQAMAALFGWATPDEEELAVLAASH